MLRINKAWILDKKREHDRAVEQLGKIALDPASTFATEHMAKAMAANIFVSNCKRIATKNTKRHEKRGKKTRGKRWFTLAGEINSSLARHALFLCVFVFFVVPRWRSDKVPGFCSDELPRPFTVRVERRPWERFAGGFQMLEERRRTCTPVPYLRRRCRPTWSGMFMRMNNLHSSCVPEPLRLVRAPMNAGPAQPTTGALRMRGPLRQPTQ